MIAPTSFFSDYGCHVRILEEAQVLQQLGNRVTICTYFMGHDVDGLDIRRTRPFPWRTHYEVGSSRHKIGFDVLLLARTISLALQAAWARNGAATPRFDVVHGHLHEGALIGWVASRLLGIPLVFDFQGSMTGEMIDHRFLNPKGPLYRPWRWLEESIVRLPSAVITSSQHAASLLQQEFHCAPDKITAVPDCANGDFFAPRPPVDASAALKAGLDIPAEREVVVYLGLLAEWQGTGLLLQAAQQLLSRRPNAHFLIMGYPSVEFYRLQAQTLGLNSHVTFTGKVPYDQAPGFLALGDVAVAPKISATEGSGKLLNYMAMGLPTVAFDVPVSREYLAEAGIYAQPGDATSLALALERALAVKEDSQARGQALRQRAVEHYSWGVAGAMIMDVYDRVCRKV